MDKPSRLLYTSSIEKVTFSLSGSGDIINDSYVSVTNSDLFRNGIPVGQGVCDAHLGTADHSYGCQTCFNGKNDCTGHPGHIDLKYPIYNTMGLNEMRKWIKLICHACGKPVLAEAQYMQIPRNKRLDEAAKLASSSNKKCVHCNEPHPEVKKDKVEPMLLHAEWFDENKRKIKDQRLYPHDIERVLSKLEEDENKRYVTMLVRTEASHPRNLTLRAIQVPGTSIRPDVRKIGGGRSKNDDLTTMLQIILKRNEAIPSIIPAEISPKLEKAIFDLCNAFNDYVKAGGEDSMGSIAKRWKGKQGRFRQNQLGKRAHQMCRTVVKGDPRLKVNEFGMPLSFAQTIKVKEYVQDYNKERLMTYVMNGRKRYPGCTKIIKASTGAEYGIESAQDIELETGDCIYRDVIDGDIAEINRQPSLMPSNITALKVVVYKDARILALGINVMICSFFNADFDGDAMNIIIYASPESRNEVYEQAGATNWLISHITSSPAIGQVDDSIVGIFELTRSEVAYDKYHAMLLYQNATILPTFTQSSYTGRETVSMLFDETPLNFTRATEFFQEQLVPYVNYDPTEIKVKIENGKLISGVLDKKSISKGAQGGLYHVIANEYSAEKSIDCMFNTQQLAIAHIYLRGFTIGIRDLLIDKEYRKQIEFITSDLVNKSLLLTDKLNNGEIIPPITQTTEEYYESQQIEILKVLDDYTDPILRAIDPKTNALLKLIMCGSKGKFANMFNMVSGAGQKLINGERIRQRYGYKRSLPYFPRFDTSPESRGFIRNSYLAGMNLVEYIVNAMAARFDLISKALSTSITGEQNRKSIKNLESIIINNFRAACKHMNIIQLIFGDNYLDPRKVERCRFPTVSLSNADFAAKYENKAFPDEFNALSRDRARYRDLFMQVELMNLNNLFSDERRVGCNVERCIEGIVMLADANRKAPEGAQLAECVKAVAEFVEGIPYMFINEIQRARKMPIPAHVAEASWLIQMLVRSHLCANQIIAKKLDLPLILAICAKIQTKLYGALIGPGTAVGIIAAQSFSEPFTQYMLDAHHRSASGGTSKGGIVRAKEVLGAKTLENSLNPAMTIFVHREHSANKAKVQDIANNIEVMRLKNFITLWQIFFEQYGAPVHPKYAHERAYITEFAKINPLLQPPADLVKWCIRVQLNKTSLILKNMSLELIVTQLREQYPDIYVVYTPENSKVVILRIYLRNVLFKGTINTDMVREFSERLIETVIRGVDGIIATNVVKIMRNEITEDGEIKRGEVWAIQTNGVNLAGVMCHPDIDPLLLQTDAIREVERVYGIEAAYQKIISELRNLVDNIYHAHYQIYANEMTFTGRVSSIERSGLAMRESQNVLLKTAFAAPMQSMETAALTGAIDTIMGVSAPLLIGSVPKIGTIYNRVAIDVDFVREHVENPDKLLEEL